MKFLKTTLIGGVFFLVPIAVLVLVIGKAIGVMLVIAEPMADFLPVDSIGGLALANLIALGIVILTCFLAGLVARAKPAQQLAEAVETKIMQRLPGYALLKGFTTTLNPEQTEALKPVLVSLGSASRIGLEVEKVGDDRIAVYFPDSPNAWSGIVQIVAADQATPINASTMSVIEHAEQMGRGTHKILAVKQKDLETK